MCDRRMLARKWKITHFTKNHTKNIHPFDRRTTLHLTETFFITKDTTVLLVANINIFSSWFAHSAKRALARIFRFTDFESPDLSWATRLVVCDECVRQISCLECSQFGIIGFVFFPLQKIQKNALVCDSAYLGLVLLRIVHMT